MYLPGRDKDKFIILRPVINIIYLFYDVLASIYFDRESDLDHFV